MQNIINFEEKMKEKEEQVNVEGVNFGLKFISMPSPLKDELTASYRDLSIKLQTIIDLLANGKELSDKHQQVLEELKQEVEVMASTDKHYVGILEAARKAGYYND